MTNLKIATFNVNSINARLENFTSWLKECDPDIVLVQEIKSQLDNFPFMDIKFAGYDAKILGQKSYNGVAIISKHKIEITEENLPNFEDEQKRYLEALIEVEGEKIRVATIYAPNGNPPYNDPNDKSKFEYKLKWTEALYSHAKKLLNKQEICILGGDYNTILTPKDAYDISKFKNDALYQPETIQRFKAIENLGYYDAYKALHPKENAFTYWDYANSAFIQDWGIRIDYLMLSPMAIDRLKKCYVDKSPRGKTKPSDHTALICEIEV